MSELVAACPLYPTAMIVKRVRSEGIWLNNALVIVMQSPDGKMIARLSARLGR